MMTCLFDGISNYVLSMHVPCACKLVLLYSVEMGQAWGGTHGNIQLVSHKKFCTEIKVLRVITQNSGNIWNASVKSLLQLAGSLFKYILWSVSSVHLSSSREKHLCCRLLCAALLCWGQTGGLLPSSLSSYSAMETSIIKVNKYFSL